MVNFVTLDLACIPFLDLSAVFYRGGNFQFVSREMFLESTLRLVSDF